jgi:hypothetical protein
MAHTICLKLTLEVATPTLLAGPPARIAAAIP